MNDTLKIVAPCLIVFVLTVLAAFVVYKMLEKKKIADGTSKVKLAEREAESIVENAKKQANETIKAAEAEAEGPSVVSVILTSFGESKTAVIKVVKEITGLGLVEAKGLVDKCPSPIKENIGVEEAETIKKKLMDAGASVDLK